MRLDARNSREGKYKYSGISETLCENELTDEIFQHSGAFDWRGAPTDEHSKSFFHVRRIHDVQRRSDYEWRPKRRVNLLNRRQRVYQHAGCAHSHQRAARSPRAEQRRRAEDELQRPQHDVLEQSSRPPRVQSIFWVRSVSSRARVAHDERELERVPDDDEKHALRPRVVRLERGAVRRVRAERAEPRAVTHARRARGCAPV